MTTTLARLTQVTLDGITWEHADTSTPGGCDRVGWCDGHCRPLRAGALGDVHSRYIGSALRDTGDLIEIRVMQWKADPAQPWYIGASAGCYDNRDQAPLVEITTYPAEGLGRHLRLTRADAATAAEALRMVGAAHFADALDAASRFARELAEEMKR